MDKEEWQKLSATIKQTVFKASKLVPMKDYVFRVSAENQYGIGTPAEHVPIIAKYSFGEQTLVSNSGFYCFICIKNDLLFFFVSQTLLGLQARFSLLISLKML